MQQKLKAFHDMHYEADTSERSQAPKESFSACTFIPKWSWITLYFMSLAFYASREGTWSGIQVQSRI